MTIARASLVDVSMTRWYHCVVRCVRRAQLLSEGPQDRKAWLEKRLEALADVMAISVAGYCVEDHQFHVLVRLDPDEARGWSNEEVARRSGRLLAPRDESGRVVPVSNAWIRSQVKDSRTLAKARERLQSLSWFMKSLKEPLARLANRQDDTRGAFFEERFKSIAILDLESLLASCVYIDVIPVATGIAKQPQAGPYTSIRTRMRHVKAAGGMPAPPVKSSAQAGLGGSAKLSQIEKSLWLCPIEDWQGARASREGMLEDFSLASYLLLVDYSARMFRDGSAPVSRELTAIFARLLTSPESWWTRLEQLSKSRFFGRFFAANRSRLREMAAQLGVHHLANLGGCTTHVEESE